MEHVAVTMLQGQQHTQQMQGRGNTTAYSVGLRAVSATLSLLAGNMQSYHCAAAAHKTRKHITSAKQ
jgi:hypothetical protein